MMRLRTQFGKKRRASQVAGSRFRGVRGFTLIEFMTASTILTSGMLGLAMLLSAGIQSNALGGNTNLALSLAQSKIEELRNLAPTHAARTNGGSLSSSLDGYSDTSGNFIRRWSLAVGPAGAQLCSVRVLPSSVQNTTRKTVELSTVIR